MGVGIKATDYTSSFSDSVSFVFICQTMITFVWQTHDFPLWETVLVILKMWDYTTDFGLDTYCVLLIVSAIRSHIMMGKGPIDNRNSTTVNIQ